MYSPKDCSCSEHYKGEGVSANDNESLNKIFFLVSVECVN